MKFLLTQDHMGLEIQNATPTVFIRCQPNFMRTLATMVEYRLLLFLAIGQVLKILWHFKNFKIGVNGKPKMWNISKTADRRVKRTKIWDLESYSAYMEGTFDAQFVEFGLGSFSALCKISNLTIRSSPNFHLIHPKLYTGYHNHTGCHLFGRSAKNCKNYGILKYSLCRTMYCYINFQSAISPTIFIGVHPNFMRTLVTIVNLNEYEKMASST